MPAEIESATIKSLWKIVLVDDHPVVRESLALRIAQEMDLTVCAAVGSKAEAMAAVQLYQPDLAIVDMNLPDGHGLELIKDVHAYAPAIRLLVFSMHDENVYGERALRAGAQGYVMKSESPDVVIAAVHRVICGKLAVSESMSQRLMEAGTGRVRSSSAVQQLTDRELQVFRLVAEGVSTKELAARLSISVKTVESHREHIKQKLRITSGTELVATASRWMTENPSE